MPSLRFATPQHQQVFESVKEFLEQRADIAALTLSGSAARSEGSKDSDIDIHVFVKDDASIEEFRKAFNTYRDNLMSTIQKPGQFFGLDCYMRHFNVPLSDPRSWTSMPDDYELVIGNAYVYGELIFEKDNAFTAASGKYLPYYDEQLRLKRLAEVTNYCVNNLEHIPLFVERELYFQAYSRLYHASLEFLQALFISKKIYPISYDKWVKKQLVEILNLPDVYKAMVTLFEIEHFESSELNQKGEVLKELVDEYLA